jgi:hypothetical protein
VTQNFLHLFVAVLFWVPQRVEHVKTDSRAHLLCCLAGLLSEVDILLNFSLTHSLTRALTMADDAALAAALHGNGALLERETEAGRNSAGDGRESRRGERRQRSRSRRRERTRRGSGQSGQSGRSRSRRRERTPASAQSAEAAREGGASVTAASRLADWLHVFQPAGDRALQKKVAERLVSLNLGSSTVLCDASWEEVRLRWDVQDAGDHRDLAGPGEARANLRLAHAAAGAQFAQDLSSTVSRAAEVVIPGTSDQGVLARELAKLVRTNRDPKKSDFDHSESENEPGFDLRKALAKMAEPPGNGELIPPSWFVSAKRLGALAAKLQKANKSSSSNVRLATSSLEDWAPEWVGEGSSADIRKEVQQQRLKDFGTTSLARFLGNVSTFWLSHAAIGKVSFTAVLSHLLVLIRLADEKGVQTAHKYEDHLLVKLWEDQKAGRLSDLPSQLAEVSTDILLKLKLGEIEKPRAVPKAAHQGAPPHSSQGKSTGAAASSQRKLVCVKHHPAENKVCSDQRCLQEREHLDTRSKEGLERYQQVLSAIARGNARRGKKPGN